MRTRVLLLLRLLGSAIPSGFTTSRWDWTVMVTTTRESLGTLVAVAVADFAKHRDMHYFFLYLWRTKTTAAYDMSLLMHEIDGNEGRDNPSRVKRTQRAYPRPTYKASAACALLKMLWCSEPVYMCVVKRSPLLLIFRQNFVSKTICKLSFPQGSSIRFCSSDSAVRKSSSFSVSDTLL